MISNSYKDHEKEVRIIWYFWMYSLLPVGFFKPYLNFEIIMACIEQWYFQKRYKSQKIVTFVLKLNFLETNIQK